MVVFVTIWAVALNWLAYQKGVYRLPRRSIKEMPLVRTVHLIAIFGIYLIFSFILARAFSGYLLLFLNKVDPEIKSLSIPVLTGVQFFFMLGIFVSISWYLSSQDKPLYQKIWKDRDREYSFPIPVDFGVGIMFWFLSFPIVTLLGEISDQILKSLFGLETYEQTAVRFVKAAMKNPASIFFALSSVLILAPLVEEFLFRGVLQTYLKKRIGVKAAILLSAFFFALFHFSPSQGLGNITLLLSLLILGGFLGFLYEKRGSLWAPVGLHMTFNAISALRILFFPEII